MDLRKLGEMARAEYRPTLISFYNPFFPSLAETEQFVDRCHARMSTDPVPGRILHNVERLIGLADDIMPLRRARDSHFVFFALVCVEAIHQTANPDSNMRKVDIIKEFFEQWVSEDDRKHLQQCVVRSAADDRWIETERDQLSLETIARIFNAVRNDFVHEGIGWGFHFCSYDHVPILNTLEVGEYPKDTRGERDLTVSLTRDEFRSVIIRGAIQVIHSLM